MCPLPSIDMVIDMPKYQATLTEIQRKILALWNQDKTGSHIAFELNMTRNAVMGQLNRLRIKGHIAYRVPQRKNNGTEHLTPVTISTRAPQTIKPKEPSAPKGPNTTELIMAKVIEKLVPTKKDGLKVPLVALNYRSCRYPVSGKGPSDYLFCGDQRMEGKPYCKEHHALCYVPRSTTRRIESLSTSFRRNHGPAHP